MYILEDIWAGNFSPIDRVIRMGSPYQKLSHEAYGWLETFREELSPEGKKAFDKYYDAHMAMWEISEKDAFIRGVRLGAGFILDIIGEYHSDLPLED